MAWTTHKILCQASSERAREDARYLTAGLTKKDRPNEPEVLSIWYQNARNKNYTEDQSKSDYEHFDEAKDNTIVYPYPWLVLTKSRDCYCYYYTMGGNAQKPATLIVRASQAAGVSAADIEKQMRSPAGEGFFQCNHVCPAEASWVAPGHYFCWFDS
eukprot:gb/GEZN01017546.1/.p1 GENE.gb/GEZN01017546.1/~~gb/GEZN01017546.1/.p1  ORF type:complete len:157 (-),score=9.03 gb/GEZN01017546.1/:9-479(-)